MVLPTALQGRYPWAMVENKWFRLVVFAITMFLTTVTYYGWQHYKFFLHDDGWLIHLCPQKCLDDPGHCGGDAKEQTSQATCLSQYNAWNAGYTYASSMEAVGSLVAGFMFDHIGPFGTALLGQGLHYGSWFMIINSKNSKTLWSVGNFMNGLSVNFTAFPAFTLIDLFPSYRFLMTAIVLGGQVSAVGVMPILYDVNKFANAGLSKMMTGYLLCGALPFSFLYLLSLPLNKKHLRLEFARKGIEVEEKKGKFSAFLRCSIKPETMLFCLWYIVMLCQYNFYFSQLENATDHDVASIQGTVMLAQGPLAILFGWFNDLARTLPMCSLLTIMQIYSFAMVTMTKRPLQYTSAILVTISNAHVYTTKFCYAAEIFPPEHFGKISGVLSFLAGVAMFVNECHFDIDTGMGMYFLLTIPQAAILVYLIYRQFVLKITWLSLGVGSEEKTTSLPLPMDSIRTSEQEVV